MAKKKNGVKYVVKTTAKGFSRIAGKAKELYSKYQENQRLAPVRERAKLREQRAALRESLSLERERMALEREKLMLQKARERSYGGSGFGSEFGSNMFGGFGGGNGNVDVLGLDKAWGTSKGKKKSKSNNQWGVSKNYRWF